MNQALWMGAGIGLALALYWICLTIQRVTRSFIQHRRDLAVTKVVLRDCVRRACYQALPASTKDWKPEQYKQLSDTLFNLITEEARRASKELQ